MSCLFFLTQFFFCPLAEQKGGFKNEEFRDLSRTKKYVHKRKFTGEGRGRGTTMD